MTSLALLHSCYEAYSILIQYDIYNHRYNVVSVAQWIQRWISNPKVLGSNPGWDNILYRNNIDQKLIFVQIYKNSVVCNKNVGKIISEKN